MPGQRWGCSATLGPKTVAQCGLLGVASWSHSERNPSQNEPVTHWGREPYVLMETTTWLLEGSAAHQEVSEAA
jgi:hypothetical protein